LFWRCNTIKLSKNKNLRIKNNDKWIISENPTCEIIDETGEEFIFKNKNGIKSKINKELIIANQIEVKGNQLLLTNSMYHRYIVESERIKSKERFDQLFNENKKIIFKNKKMVLTQPEFFFLRPSYLVSGSSLGPSFGYSLGTLFESVESGNHYHLESFLGHRNLYLISLRGSILTGSFCSIFWSETSKELIALRNKESLLLPHSFGELLCQFRQQMKEENTQKIDFQEVVLQNLLVKIKKLDK